MTAAVLFQSESIEKIETALKSVLTFPDSSQEKLFEAARYSVLNGGKRLRPQLVLAACSSLGGDFNAAILPAAALELIHCYSLIHDDLPAMDNDDFRRGKPSLHRYADEGTAILTGDFLLTYAFELIATAPLLSEKKKVDLIAALAKASGGQGMVAGQLLDLEASHEKKEAPHLREIHLKKSAELIACGVLFGAIIAGVDAGSLELCRSFGLEIGLAFQVQDDILDADGQDEGKATYVGCYGLDASKRIVQELKTQAVEKLKRLPLKNGHLEELALRMVP